MHYSCENCNYSSDRKSSFEKHLQSEKHVAKVINKTQSTNIPTLIQQISNGNQNFICQYCRNTYSSQSNLNKHLNKCYMKIRAEKDDDKNKITETVKKELEIEYLKKQLDDYHIKVNSLENDKKKLEDDKKKLEEDKESYKHQTEFFQQLIQYNNNNNTKLLK